MATTAATRQSHRLLRAHRAAIRLESRRDADSGGAPGQLLRAERRENVDHQWLAGGRRRHLGQNGRWRRPRLSGREGHQGIQSLGRPWQMVVASVRDFRSGHDRLRDPRTKPATQSRRPEGAARLSNASALRYRLGRHRGGHGLLRYGPAIRQDAEAVRQPADRLPPTSAGQAGGRRSAGWRTASASWRIAGPYRNRPWPPRWRPSRYRSALALDSRAAPSGLRLWVAGFVRGSRSRSWPDLKSRTLATTICHGRPRL